MALPSLAGAELTGAAATSASQGAGPGKCCRAVTSSRRGAVSWEPLRTRRRSVEAQLLLAQPGSAACSGRLV